MIEKEPNRPLNLFRLGPRILISSDNLNDLNLISNKSRVEYKTLFKIEDEALLTKTYNELSLIKNIDEDLDYHFQENSTLERFTLNFLFFIKLISIFIIFITGIGITSTLTSLLLDMRESVGIKKILGEKSNTTFKYYLIFVLSLSIIGFLFSIIFSKLLTEILPNIFSNVLPKDIVLELSAVSILEGFIITIFLSIFFTITPLLKTKYIKPISIFRKEEINLNKKTIFLVYALLIIFFSLIIFLELKELRNSIYILLGSIMGLLIIYFGSQSIILYFKKLNNKVMNLKLKLSINGLSRIGNKTIMIIFSLSLSLTLIFSLTFIENNLQDNFIESFPENSPNLFLLDIPKNEIENLSKIFNSKINIYPIIRAPILEINSENIQSVSKRLGRGEPVTRDFSLTYSNEILDSEKLIEGDSLFKNNWNNDGIEQISVLDEIAERLEVGVGDRIKFLVQGIEIEAEIVSIRTRIEQGIGAFFYFTFEPKVLEKAPQTVFSTHRVESSQIPKIQLELAKKYPQITVINAETTAKTVGEIISDLSEIISFFTIFSLVGGVLILISSIYATNFERIKESVYYKLVGAKKNFIRDIFLIEYFILGICSIIISIVLSILISFSISHFIFDINYTIPVLKSFVYIITTILVILIIGYLSIIKPLNKKPIEYIRENNIE